VKETVGKLNSSGLRFAVVVSRFNSAVTERLLEGALDVLRRTGCAEDALEVVRTPGSFEIPAVVEALAERGSCDGIICLGAIIKGETNHHDYLAARVTHDLGAISVKRRIAVGYGIITADTVEQALDRAGLKQGNKGADAAMAVIEMADLLKQLAS
jgi:6,7-dimethyl-8-ribityllumazine synthase